MTLNALNLPDATFDQRLREVLYSRIEFIQLIGDDLVTAGGKRIRPLIVFLVAQALGYTAHTSAEKWSSVVDLAVCVELLHSASLLHDDLIDDADTRRGKQTAVSRFGNVVSVMSGDFMLARLLSLLAGMPHSDRLVGAFGQTASAICEGEVLQFQVASYADYSLDNYWQIIHGKTAALLELSACAPAMMLGCDPSLSEALLTFGREYGMAFQLRDDWLDLLGDEKVLGKPIGSDLREGKVTYPVLILLEGEHESEIRTILERGANQEDINRIRHLAWQKKDLVENELRARIQRATAALQQLPESAARTALQELVCKELQRVL